ncbi:MAG: VOC family protein [Acidobacteriaceae bacterium]
MRNRSVPVETVMPHVVYQNLPEAMAWLSRVFGFEEHFRYGEGPSGAQFWAGRAYLMVRGARGEGAAREKSPRELGFGTQSLTIFVDDVDGHYARTKAEGAEIVEEPHETVYGEYQYAAKDLDGHLWLFSRHAKDLRPEDWGGTSRSGGDALCA